jgi:hypothetical protein
MALPRLARLTDYSRLGIPCASTSRVALALARTRLMAAKYPYYLMADTPEGQRFGG